MRRRFSKKQRPKEDMSLQITSMADIFTIILVFMLKTLSVGITGITPHNVTLPEVRTGSEAVESLKLEVGNNAILVDGKAVTHLSQFHFDETDLESDRTSRSLNAALIREMKAQTATTNERTPASASRKETLLVLADEKAPYSLLKSVMASATRAGFSDFRLVVVEDQ